MALTPGGRSLDPAKIDAAYVAYMTTFANRLTKTNPIFSRIAGVAMTDAEITTQIWLSSAPAMREWKGPKLLKKFRGLSHTIKTKPYEASVLVPKTDIMTDRYGLYADQIGQMGERYPEALDKLVCDVLNAGVTGTTLGATYDGQNLIDTDHTIVVGGASQTNQVTGALTQTVFNTAFERFGAMKDDEGVPLIRVPRTLLTGYANRTAARTILEQRTLASGAENIDAASVDLIISPYISGTNWFLFVANPRAIVLQIRRSVEFLAVDQPNGDFAFDTGNFKYGIEAEFGALPGLWEDVVGGPGS